MHKTSDRQSVVVESDFHKLKSEGDQKDIKDIQSRSLGHSTTFLSREDSISSNRSISSFIPSIKKSFDGSWSSGSVAGIYTPRIEKTQVLFDILLRTLNEMYDNYSKTTCTEECTEDQDYTEMLFKIDDRISMIDSFKVRYLVLVNQRQDELNKIDANIRSYLNNKQNKQMLEINDSEAYWIVCRELFVTESKLERCTGKLQFQIMELDFIGKINPLDQYELSIRLNETSKFKTKIKIEKNGHQVWESRNFVLNPGIDDFLYVKFSELKPLNKSVVIVDKKVPFINNLIRSDPSIFMFWLSPVGSVKLKVIVQWNPVLIDPALETYLSGLENKFLEGTVKTETPSLYQRPASHKNANNRLSSNIESLFRSGNIEKNSRSNSMNNILEDVEEDKCLGQDFRQLYKPTESSSMVKSITSDAIVDRVSIDSHTETQPMENVPRVIISDEEPVELVPDSAEPIICQPIILRAESIDVVVVVDTESALPERDDSCIGDEIIENMLTGDCMGIESPVVGDSDCVTVPLVDKEESVLPPVPPEQQHEIACHEILADGDTNNCEVPASNVYVTDEDELCLRHADYSESVSQDSHLEHPSGRDRALASEERQRLLAEIRAAVFSLEHSGRNSEESQNQPDSDQLNLAQASTQSDVSVDQNPDRDSEHTFHESETTVNYIISPSDPPENDTSVITDNE